MQHHAVRGVVRSRAVGEVPNDGVAYRTAVDSQLVGAAWGVKDSSEGQEMETDSSQLWQRIFTNHSSYFKVNDNPSLSFFSKIFILSYGQKDA